jgi:hypothetical protein
LSGRAVAVLGAAALALVGAPVEARARHEAGPEAGELREAGTAQAPRRADRRCRRPRRARRFACTRVKRLAAPPVPERLLAVAPPAPPVADAPAPGGAPPSQPPPPLPRFASVAAREWSLTLSRPVVGAGAVTIELRNLGEDPHNLVVSPDDGSHAPVASWAETGPGGVLRQSVTLPAGRYLLFCSLEGHEAAGMSARLRVE